MTGLSAQARTLGAEVAAPLAAEVDRDARFPREAFAALKSQRLLGALVPQELGGGGATLFEVAAACHALARACGSTGMIYAMHQIQVACLVNHGRDSAWHRRMLERIAAEQLLIASATTEAETGGDIRTSVCAVETAGTEGAGQFTLRKNASVISYGDEADLILATARRTPEAPASDQVVVAVERGQYRLERTTGWDTLGMRGTCSNGYRLTAEADTAQILPLPFADLSARTMLPTTHIVWGAVWLGIAADAVGRARAFVRAEARRKPGNTPPCALRLAEATALLHQMRASLLTAIRQYEMAAGSPDLLGAMSFATAMGTLKVSLSELALQAVDRAMRTCGLAAYRNDTPFSLGRHLRDAQSAALMIGNDRILAHTATQLLVQKDGTGPFD